MVRRTAAFGAFVPSTMNCRQNSGSRPRSIGLSRRTWTTLDHSDTLHCPFDDPKWVLLPCTVNANGPDHKSIIAKVQPVDRDIPERAPPQGIGNTNGGRDACLNDALHGLRNSLTLSYLLWATTTAHTCKPVGAVLEGLTSRNSF